MKNYVKKFIMITLMTVIALFVTACGSGGKYYRIESYGSGDNVQTIEAGTKMARQNYIEFTDGTNGVISVNGITGEFTVEGDKIVIVSDGTEYPFTEDGERITLKSQGDDFVYVKSEKPVADKKALEMVGLYVIDSITSGRITEDKDSLDRYGYSNYYINVKDGWTVTLEFDGRLLTLEITPEAFISDELTVPYTYTDGELKITFDGTEFTFKPGERSKRLVPQGYYKLQSMKYGESTLGLDFLRSTALKDCYMEVGSDGHVYLNTGNGIGTFIMEGTEMSNSTEGTISLRYRQKTAYVQLNNDIMLTLVRSEKPEQSFPAGSYSCSSIYRSNQLITEDEISAEGLENITLKMDENYNVTLTFKGEDYLMEKDGNNYYLNGKSAMLTRIDNNIIINAFDLDFEFFLF